MSVVWDFIKNVYSDAHESIGNIDNDFIKGLLFLLLWLWIFATIGSILALSIPFSPTYSNKWIGLGIVIGVIIIEVISFIGRLVYE